MPILDLNNFQWEEDGALKWKRIIRYNGLTYKKSMIKAVNIKRTNNLFDCLTCGKKRGKGTRYVGNNYERICHYCLDDWCKNSIMSLKEIIQSIKETNKEFKKNESKWNKDALVGALTIKDDSSK